MTAQKTTQVPLKHIHRDYEGHSTQIREEMNQETVGDYAAQLKRGAEFPPIELVKDGNGKYFVVDGWHRLHAHVKATKNKINAVIHPPLAEHTPLESAMRMALSSNLTHGLRLGPGDKGKKARTALFLPQMRCLSDRKIAGQIGVSHQTVSRARNDMAREGLLPNPVTDEMVCDATPLEFTSVQAVKDTFGDVERFREVLAFIRQLEPFDASNGNEDDWESEGSMSKRDWSFDPETGEVSHKGLEQKKVVVFKIEGNAIEDGKPKHYELLDNPDCFEPEQWRPQDIDAHQRAQWEFHAAAKRLMQSGKTDLIKAVETLTKYQSEPGIFSDIRTLVTHGGPAIEHNDDF